MEKAILVTVKLAKREEWTAQDKADELRELAVSAGAKVVGELIVNMKAPHSACFIGSGKAEEIAALCASKGANAVIFNSDLSGTQQKNLEEVVKAKTITDTAERTKLYQQAQVIFKEQAPWFTIAHAVQLKPMRKEVIDFKLSPFGRHTFYGVDIKE